MPKHDLDFIHKVIDSANKLQSLQKACEHHGTYETYLYYLIEAFGFIIKKERSIEKRIGSSSHIVGDKPIHKFLKDDVVHALSETNGNIREASRIFGMTRQGIYNCLKRNGLTLKTRYYLKGGKDLDIRSFLDQIIKDANELQTLQSAYRKNKTYLAMVSHYLKKLNLYIHTARSLVFSRKLGYTDLIEIQEVIDLLNGNNCDVRKTGEALNYSHQSIRHKLKKYGISINNEYSLKERNNDN